MGGMAYPLQQLRCPPSLSQPPPQSQQGTDGGDSDGGSGGAPAHLHRQIPLLALSKFVLLG